jgi:hypothetical protein
MPGSDAGLVSVVIPARNESAGIGALVRAVAAQDTPTRRGATPGAASARAASRPTAARASSFSSLDIRTKIRFG